MRALKSPIVASTLVCAGVTILLYGSALALPLYSDDLLHVPWIKASSFLDFWHTVGPYEDYRPLQFAVWRLVYLLTGDLRPGLLYGLNLASHALCGTLLGLLATRWGGRSSLAAPLAASFFVAFPFAFNVVLWTIAFSYPLSTALALGALLVYLHARERGTLPHHLLAIALTALAGFAYETGVATGLTILWAEVTIVKGRASRWPAIYLAASALPLLPIVRFSPVPSYFRGLPQSALDIVVALQSFAFPVAPLATMARRIGMDPVLTMGWMGIAALLVLGYGARKGGRLRWFWFGLGWAILWASIPLAVQHNNWVMDPLRALYPSAAGTAVIWGVGLAGIPPHRLRSRSSLLRFALLVAALTPGLFFVRGRMELHRRVGDLLWEVISAARGSDTPVLFVNLPERITPGQRFYPLGHEGVIPLPPPTNADILVQAHNGQAGIAIGRAMGEVLPPLPYAVWPVGVSLRPDDLRAAGRAFVVRYGPAGMRLEEAGAVLPPQEPGSAVARFGQKVLLLSASCRREGHAQVILSADWQVVEPVEGAPTVFAHLLGADGSLLSQADGNPLLGLFPFSLWRPGEVVHDVRTFDGVPPGPATVALGVWDPTVGVRWAALGTDGEPLPEHAFRCEVGEP